MTAATEPRGGFDYGWDPGEDGWGPNMNANLLRLSRFGFHASVLSMATTAPPGSPTSGAGYIIPAGATGAWAGKTGQVAVWDGSAWVYAVPRDGWTVHVVNVGLVVYEDGAWSQSNLATASGVGAEPYAGAPAQTSFWRSTAAGVRAWVQLVAADITDLATTLAGYLTKANPTFTGLLSGPSGKFGSTAASGSIKVQANNSGTGLADYDFLGGAAGNRRMTARWSDSLDSFAIMSSNDDGTARLDRIIVPRSSSLPITVAGGAAIDGELRAQTAVDASSFQWTPDANEGVSFFGSTSVAESGFGYHSLVIHSNDSEAAGRNLGALSFGQKVSEKSGGYPGLKAFIRGEAYGSGGSVGGFGGRVVIAARGDNASFPSDVASFDTTKVALVSGIPLYQGATERITAGGDGRFASLRASGLVASSTYLTRLDANGELVASSIKEDLGDIGNAGTFRTVFGRIVLLTPGYGTWTSGANYDSWGPSIVCPVSDDTLANGSGATPSGGIWNSQRLNALTITDGASATPYRGRIRADRWFATSFLQIQNTTTATSWFAAGTGDGSPTLPANYLKSGRRVHIHGRIFCPSSAVNSNPEIVLKVGGTAIFTVSKQFTMAAGNEIVITIKSDMFIDDSNRLIVIGEQEFYAFASGMYVFKANGQIDPYVGTSSKTIDITIKPSSTSETWIRSLAFIEI